MPEEPFFGYLRGRYSVSEVSDASRLEPLNTRACGRRVRTRADGARMQMQAIAQHASDLGLELIPAIQVLGHLEQLLHWPAYSHVRDTPNVLLASEDDRAFQLLVRGPSELRIEFQP